MTNKIIEAARSAGFRTGAITLTGTTIEPIPFIAPVSATDCKNELARFYALARAEALEDAAQACRPFGKTGAVVAAAIKALKDQQHG